MKEFPKDIKFKFNWRSYQKRVLDDLDKHLDDNRLHIIAPPGSGKTILGLEVAIRLNKPTLIFAPTVAIRNQWVQRFCELFLQIDDEPEWISRDIKNPKFFTVVTYQALHAATRNGTVDEELLDTEDDEKDAKPNVRNNTDIQSLIRKLKAQGIKTFVVDEAHHLKNEWWKSLNTIKDEIDPIIVGLTATPPYDGSYAEWQRYIELNGPVDAEISVPELVAENDLCPHQDYIYLSEPTLSEKEIIANQRAKANKLFGEIKNDEILVEAIMSHPIFQFPEQHLDWIYTNLSCYSAVLIFLNSVGKPITKKHKEIVGDKKYKIPKLNFEWLEILLHFYLFQDKEYFSNYEVHKEKLINRLKRHQLMEKKRISFTQNKQISSSLNTSLSKLQSIDNVVDIEHDTLGDKLRMVILTDYIRKEFLSTETENNIALNKIGVLPIFEQLRRTNDRNMKLGILSGSLVIIPQSALNIFKASAEKMQVKNILYTPLAYDNNYVIIKVNEKIKHSIVHLVTSIFELGEIEVLVGTKSLLGEGWDAPTINALILASFVGSYVLSNQMRGRAIRSDRNNVDKTGNIWHLVCVDTTTDDGGDDFQLMKRRFKSFVGISNNQEATIEDGVARLHLPEEFEKSNIKHYNDEIIRKAGQRNLLKQQWDTALINGKELIEEIKVPFSEEEDYKYKKSLYYNKTIANLLGELGAIVLTFLDEILDGFLQSDIEIREQKELLWWLTIIGGMGMLLFGARAYRTFRIYIKYRDISKDIQQIGEALLHTLIKMKTIKTDISQLSVESSIDDFGAIYCHLDGGTTFEKSIFIKSLQEIISAIDSPRYLINRKNKFLKIISQNDYHSVPELIGRNKKTAQFFEQQWRKLVGSCQLVYTRTIEGRKVLLKSRINSLSSEFVEKAERINKWR